MMPADHTDTYKMASDNSDLEELRRRRLAYFNQSNLESMEPEKGQDKVPTLEMPSRQDHEMHGLSAIGKHEDIANVCEKTTKDELNLKLLTQNETVRQNINQSNSPAVANCMSSVKMLNNNLKNLQNPQADIDGLGSEAPDAVFNSCGIRSSFNIEDLGLSTHRPESNRTMNSMCDRPETEVATKCSTAYEVTHKEPVPLEDTLGDFQLRELLGEEKYQLFLEKSRRDLEALKLERRPSTERSTSTCAKAAVQDTEVCAADMQSKGSKEFSHHSGGGMSPDRVDREAPRLNRPKDTPSLVSSTVVKSRGELDREAPHTQHVYGGKNYEQTNVAHNVAYSSNHIYQQAFREIPYNPYQHQEAMWQNGGLQGFSPRHFPQFVPNSNMVYGYPNANSFMHSQPIMYYTGCTPPASPVVQFSPHPPLYPGSQPHPVSPHPPPGVGFAREPQPFVFYQPHTQSSVQMRHDNMMANPPSQRDNYNTGNQYISGGAAPSTQHQFGQSEEDTANRLSQYRPRLSSQGDTTRSLRLQPGEGGLSMSGAPLPHPPDGERRPTRRPHAEHIEGVRHFHENRRKQLSTESRELNTSQQFAVDRLETYFSSIEQYYPRTDGREEHAALVRADEGIEVSPVKASGMDEELETLVASTITNLKAEGVTERLRDLGIEIPFLQVKQQATAENATFPVQPGDIESPALIQQAAKPSKPKEAKICPECASMNKSYMSWCANCGEVLIGVEVTLLGSHRQEQTTVTVKEGEDSGFDDKVSPMKPKVHFAEQKPKENDQEICTENGESESVLEHRIKSRYPDGLDSGRGPSSGEERDVTPYSGRTEKEILSICESIGDPVIRGFLRSYLRKRHLNKVQSVKAQSEIAASKHGKRNKKSDREKKLVETQMTDTNVWLHEARLMDRKSQPVHSSGDGINKVLDVEVFGAEEAGESGSVTRNGHAIPLLDLGFSSDEDKNKGRKLLDITLTDEEYDSEHVADAAEYGQGDAGPESRLCDEIPPDSDSHISEHSPNKGSSNHLSVPIHQKSRRKGFPPKNKASKQFGVVRNSVDAAPPKSRWMRSSIAWSTYNPGELNKERSMPAQSQHSTRQSQQFPRTKNRNQEHSDEDSSPSLVKNSRLQRRPASADIQRRKLAMAARPGSAGARKKTMWDGQRDINLKSRTTNLTRILGQAAPVMPEPPGEMDTVPVNPDEIVRLPTPSKNFSSPVKHCPTGTTGFEMAQTAYNMYHSMTPRICEGTFSTWLCLPDELLLFILSHLSLSDLARCARVCKHFHRVAMDQSLWRSIELTKRQDLTDDMLEVIGQHQPISLSLIQCHGTQLTGAGLQRLFQQCGSYLEELNISRCSRGALVGDTVLSQAAVTCKNLTHLDVSWTYVTNNGLAAISSSAIRLERVSLNGCQSVSNYGLETLLHKHGKSLRVLELFGCFNINQAGIRSVGLHCHNLLTLNLGQCYKVTDSTMTEVTGSLPRLETLDIRGCKQVRDASIRKIVRNCPRLTSIALANCPHISDVAVAEVATYLTRLRWIDLCGCKNITDESLRALTKNCPHLAYLDISSTSCTKRSVFSLASHCGERLEVAKLNFLSDVDEACITKLVKSCPRLNLLHLYGCKGLHALVEKLRRERPNLSIEMG